MHKGFDKNNDNSSVITAKEPNTINQITHFIFNNPIKFALSSTSVLVAAYGFKEVYKNLVQKYKVESFIAHYNKQELAIKGNFFYIIDVLMNGSSPIVRTDDLTGHDAFIARLDAKLLFAQSEQERAAKALHIINDLIADSFKYIIAGAVGYTGSMYIEESAE